MKTVHLVFNAHIDPVWLWPWNSGLDTLLATCRSACDRLDTHKDLHFSRGEAWVYREIERIDPELFARIKKHFEAGRWHIVGGWWIQPDCNGPSGFGIEQQIKLGKEYFQEKFGFFPRIGYNVDSFGHAATFPSIMRAAGQDRYVFMRPQEWEMDLPARIFRWRGHEGGPEVVTFRIAKAYTVRGITQEHVKASLTHLPKDIDHTMCFVGFGDHGGGPTEQQIAWCREHQDSIPGCKLVFSSPDQFFEAIEDKTSSLPLVTGELQHHSIGCYSVHRAVKVGVRKAEHRLVQAEVTAAHDPKPEVATVEKLKEAWRWVCFNHFHDTYGGTCIPSAYEQIHAQLGFSYAIADTVIQHGLRRQIGKIADDTKQRIVLFNASDQPYSGYAHHEAWLEAEHWKPNWRLIDDEGKPVAHQRMHAEALVPDDYLYFLRLLFRVELKPGELKTLRIDTQGVEERDLTGHDRVANSRVKVTTVDVSNDCGVSAQISGERELRFDDASIPLPRLELIEDPTDTWTHEVDRYDDQVVAVPRWEKTRPVDFGPLMSSVQQNGFIGNSELLAEYRVYAGEQFVELLLRVYWSERHKLLKLTLPLPASMKHRFDGIPGGELRRVADEKERPVRDRTLLELAEGPPIGVVFPDAYALDAQSDKIRITLLRSPLMAHHYPFEGPGRRAVYADQGMHEFRFRFFCGPKVSGALLDQHGLMMQRELVTADWTRGMRAH